MQQRPLYLIDINKDGCPYAAAPSLKISIKMDFHAACALFIDINKDGCQCSSALFIDINKYGCPCSSALFIDINKDRCPYAAAPSLLISIKMDAHMQQRPLYRYQ